jgi:hypothetical protein
MCGKLSKEIIKRNQRLKIKNKKECERLIVKEMRNRRSEGKYIHDEYNYKEILGKV